MKFKYSGDPKELRMAVAMIIPRGTWIVGRQISEYHTLEGPTIRYWPNGTVFVQGKDGPTGALFDKLFRALKNLGMISG
ncbi:hypothetical protein [Bradyrhizobium sp. AZCC 2289]|uniref:hypothetical protein n=1 Tax=Bradyrhizobium sp. AZCC 2289 TaxID=3117026 RepID=UPI002FEEDB2D